MDDLDLHVVVAHKAPRGHVGAVVISAVFLVSELCLLAYAHPQLLMLLLLEDPLRVEGGVCRMALNFWFSLFYIFRGASFRLSLALCLSLSLPLPLLGIMLIFTDHDV